MIISKIIVENAKKTGISPNLIAALIHQESAGNIYAVRYEPGFFDRYVKTRTKDTLQGFVPSMCTLETEKRLRATSFGLVQMMGQVARERGFRGQFLSEIIDPETNVRLGTEFLQTLLLKYDSTEAALLRWNGGGNKNYAKEVLGHIDSGACHYLLCC